MTGMFICVCVKTCEQELEKKASEGTSKVGLTR